MQKLNINDEERPVAVQIYWQRHGNNGRSGEISGEAHPDILDINFGCTCKTRCR